jgi:glyoxylase I family protein
MEKVMTDSVTGIGHIALRVTDLPRAKRFYAESLGFPLAGETEHACFVRIGGTTVVLIAGTAQTAPDDRFDPFRVGLDHLALAVPAATLPELKQRLDAAGVRNNGIERDDRSGAVSITFYDPDGIAWEFYASAR